MNISPEDIKKISTLARINFNKKELEEVKNKIINILYWIELLKKVNINNTQPKYSMFIKKMPYQNELQDSMNIKDIMLNAPEYTSGMFSIPKVLK